MNNPPRVISSTTTGFGIDAPGLVRSFLLGGATALLLGLGDMRHLPYPDAHFDVVVSSLAIHNLPTAADRALAVHETSRVLRPGGRVVLLDFRNTRAYARTLREAGLHEVRGSLPRLLMFPPCWIVQARKA